MGGEIVPRVSVSYEYYALEGGGYYSVSRSHQYHVNCSLFALETQQIPFLLYSLTTKRFATES